MGASPAQKPLSFVTWRYGGTARRLAHASWMGGALWALVAIAIYGFTGHPIHHWGAAGVLFDRSFLFWLPILPIVATALALYRREALVDARVVDGSLEFVDGVTSTKRRVERSSIASGWLVAPTATSAAVELTLKSGNTVRVSVAGAEAGEAMLAELGVAARQKTAKTILGPRWPAALAGMVGAIVPIVTLLGSSWFAAGSVQNVLIPVICVLAGVLASSVAMPWSINVGVDGIALSRPLRATRFFAFDDIEEVTVMHRAVIARLKSGALEKFEIALGDEAVLTLRDRIHEARAARSLGISTEAYAALDPHGKSVDAWRASLLRLLGEGQSLRNQSISRDDLRAILVDAAAPTLRRLAAAVALLATKEPGAEEAVRVAAESAADERVRVVFERVLDGTLDDDNVRAVEAQARAR